MNPLRYRYLPAVFVLVLAVIPGAAARGGEVLDILEQLEETFASGVERIAASWRGVDRIRRRVHRVIDREDVLRNFKRLKRHARRAETTMASLEARRREVDSLRRALLARFPEDRDGITDSYEAFLGLYTRATEMSSKLQIRVAGLKKTLGEKLRSLKDGGVSEGFLQRVYENRQEVMEQAGGSAPAQAPPTGRIFGGALGSPPLGRRSQAPAGPDALRDKVPEATRSHEEVVSGELELLIKELED